MSDQTKPIRFTQRILPDVALSFVRNPASVTPDEGTIAIVSGDDWQTAGVFRGGAWCTKGGSAFARPVRFWTVPVADDHG